MGGAWRQEEWERWDRVHRAATTALQDREGALERAAEEVEVNMEIVGATAIEDKLQEGVPDAVATLARAGIRIWVLTGDKQATKKIEIKNKNKNNEKDNLMNDSSAPASAPGCSPAASGQPKQR